MILRCHAITFPVVTLITTFIPVPGRFTTIYIYGCGCSRPGLYFIRYGYVYVTHFTRTFTVYTGRGLRSGLVTPPDGSRLIGSGWCWLSLRLLPVLLRLIPVGYVPRLRCYAVVADDLVDDVGSATDFIFPVTGWFS